MLVNELADTYPCMSKFETLDQNAIANSVALGGQQGVSATFWIDGKNTSAKILWLSNTHVEVFFLKPTDLQELQSAALLVRDFVSLPMQVERVYGRHLLLRFNQPLHQSVLDLVAEELLEAHLAKLGDQLEEATMPIGFPRGIEQNGPVCLEAA